MKRYVEIKKRKNQDKFVSSILLTHRCYKDANGRYTVLTYFVLIVRITVLVCICNFFSLENGVIKRTLMDPLKCGKPNLIVCPQSKFQKGIIKYRTLVDLNFNCYTKFYENYMCNT